MNDERDSLNNDYRREIKFDDVKCNSNLLPRSGHRMVYYEGNLYTFGGYNTSVADHPGPGVYPEVWKFNIASRSWNLLNTYGTQPRGHISYGADIWKNCMVVCGGTSYPFGEHVSNRVFLLNLDTLTWSSLKTSGVKPRELYGQDLKIHNDMLYMAGGTSGYAYFMSIDCLDLKTNVWTHLTDRPDLARYRHGMAIYNNILYFFGGGNEEKNFSLDMIDAFDIATCKWTQVQTLPNSGTVQNDYPPFRKHHGCVQIGSDVYIHGGVGDVDYSVLNDLWHIDLRTLQWTKLPMHNVIPPRYFHAVCTSEAGQMFTFGGVFESDRRTQELTTFWLKVPSLLQCCWTSVLNHFPHLTEIPPNVLYEIGVPVKLITQMDLPSDCDSNDIPDTDMSIDSTLLIEGHC